MSICQARWVGPQMQTHYSKINSLISRSCMPSFFTLVANGDSVTQCTSDKRGSSGWDAGRLLPPFCLSFSIIRFFITSLSIMYGHFWVQHLYVRYMYRKLIANCSDQNAQIAAKITSCNISEVYVRNPIRWGAQDPP